MSSSKGVFDTLLIPGWSFLWHQTNDTAKGYVGDDIVVYSGFEIGGRRQVVVKFKGTRQHIESEGGAQRIAFALFKEVLRTYGAWRL